MARDRRSLSCSRSGRRRRLWLLAGALLGACHTGAPEGGGRAPALMIGRTADAISLDPARVTDSESVEVCAQVFENLVRARPDAGGVEPALATHWEVSSDGTDWVFHIRPGVRFHDGTPLDADAVVFSLERQRDPKHPDHLPDFTYEAALRNIVKLEKLDPLRVHIIIERAYAPFLANLSMFALSIVSPTAVHRWGQEFRRHPVGTGPFRFVEWVPGERITLARNDDYWGPHAKLDHLSFVPVRDPRQRLVSLEGGAIDIAESLAPQDLQFIALHPELTTTQVAGNNVGYLAMNVQHPPFDDVRVREAVRLAIHKHPIVKLVYQGLAVPASGPLPPSAWARLDLPAERYDPVRARTILAAAGYDRRKHRPTLYVSSTPRPYLPEPETVARMIAEDLHAIGMDVDVRVNPIDVHLEKTSAGEHDLCLIGWSGDTFDPDNFLYLLFHSDNSQPGVATNVSFLRDKQLDGILRWAQESTDRAARERFYRQAQQILDAAVPWVPIAHSEIVIARRRSVRGLRLLPSSVVDFSATYVEGR